MILKHELVFVDFQNNLLNFNINPRFTSISRQAMQTFSPSRYIKGNSKTKCICKVRNSYLVFLSPFDVACKCRGWHIPTERNREREGLRPSIQPSDKLPFRLVF